MDFSYVLKALAQKLEPDESFTHHTLEDTFSEYSELVEISGGKLIHPTRLAVSGTTFGPGLFELMEVLGKETVLRRMNAAIDWLAKRAEGEKA